MVLSEHIYTHQKISRRECSICDVIERYITFNIPQPARTDKLRHVVQLIKRQFEMEPFTL